MKLLTVLRQLKLGKALLLLISFIFSTKFSIFCTQNNIKEIKSDVTEFDRVRNTVSFLGNVQIYLKNGYVSCQKAYFDRSKQTVKCLDKVYFLMTSTENASKIEVRSNLLSYSLLKGFLEFKEHCKVEYDNKKEKLNLFIHCDDLTFDEIEQKITCANNILISNDDGEIFCDKAEYFLKDKLLYMNNNLINLTENQRVKFNSLRQDIKLKTFTSNSAVIDYNKNRISLVGNVQAEF